MLGSVRCIRLLRSGLFHWECLLCKNKMNDQCTYLIFCHICLSVIGLNITIFSMQLSCNILWLCKHYASMLLQATYLTFILSNRDLDCRILRSELQKRHSFLHIPMYFDDQNTMITLITFWQEVAKFCPKMFKYSPLMLVY